MYVQVGIARLMDQEGNLAAGFPVREFLRMFPAVTARDSRNGRVSRLRGKPRSAPELEISFGDDDESLAHVKYLLAQVDSSAKTRG